MPQAVEIESALRIRIAVMRLSRLLRPTEAGLAADLSPTRVAVLLNVVRNAPVRLAQVAEDEGLNPTLLSRTVAWLAETGLLSRTADPEDRRSAWLEPTEAGLALARRIREERTEAMENALADLSPAARATIEAALPALEALAERLGR
ncbi:MarR family winged helix-turn-helix transcriptional regulator [Conexibacter sp. DBS9H8]|uniref:MarR family winged helix-turn-helix transcriptional regulator n=1 Tax=Conexibacter sp. DBS9H8 TaxID=2937801 RepID=UPI00200E33EF|nr:MarR family transcriptional regulator [Conexibacter sp. DBS9H8]